MFQTQYVDCLIVDSQTSTPVVLKPLLMVLPLLSVPQPPWGGVINGDGLIVMTSLFIFV